MFLLLSSPGVTHHVGWWGRTRRSCPHVHSITSLPRPGTRGRGPDGRRWIVLQESHPKSHYSVGDVICWINPYYCHDAADAGDGDGDVSKLADVPAAKRKGVKRPQPKLDSQRCEPLQGFCTRKVLIKLSERAAGSPDLDPSWRRLVRFQRCNNPVFLQVDIGARTSGPANPVWKRPLQRQRTRGEAPAPTRRRLGAASS